VQVEVVGQQDVFNADAVLARQDMKADLVLGDLEFVETRQSRAESQQEKELLERCKKALEAEQILSEMTLSEEEKKALAAYSVVTARPCVFATQEEAADPQTLLARTLARAGYASFFTTGEKETRAWLIRQGLSAWEAAGVIHSDIQKGFIRAEIIAYEDFLAYQGETGAKQAGKMRLEPKEYAMKDTDIATFRFNRS
jgi:ribosome-binding ATPase YchF (GTP1/OBG family)